jgi:hypothetical protein
VTNKSSPPARQSHPLEAWIPLITLVFCIALSWIGPLSYELNPTQVLQFWHKQVPPLGASDDLLAKFPHANVHYIRYLIAYPGLLADQHLGRPLLGQSVYTSFFLGLNCALWFRAKRLFRSNSSPIDLPFCCFVAIQIFLMNGRGVLIWTGLLTLLLAMISITKQSGNLPIIGSHILSCIAFLLGTLSTGSYFVIVASYICMLPRAVSCIRQTMGLSKTIGLFIIPSSIIITYGLGYAKQALVKVLEYYSWRIAGLMSHGILHFSWASQHGWIQVGAILFAIACLSYSLQALRDLIKRAYNGEFMILALPATMSLIASAFGLTGGSLAIPPLLLVASTRWPIRQ